MYLRGLLVFLVLPLLRGLRLLLILLLALLLLLLMLLVLKLLLMVLRQRRALHRMVLWRRRRHVSHRLSRKLGRRWLRRRHGMPLDLRRPLLRTLRRKIGGKRRPSLVFHV